ncbi:MAG: hypothetical protein DRN08_06125, partial [Thermoplasmata archaeon]
MRTRRLPHVHDQVCVVLAGRLVLRPDAAGDEDVVERQRQAGLEDEVVVVAVDAQDGVVGLAVGPEVVVVPAARDERRVVVLPGGVLAALARRAAVRRPGHQVQ